jgi:hypothetical protein
MHIQTSNAGPVRAEQFRQQERKMKDLKILIIKDDLPDMDIGRDYPGILESEYPGSFGPAEGLGVVEANPAGRLANWSGLLDPGGLEVPELIFSFQPVS